MVGNNNINITRDTTSRIGIPSPYLFVGQILSTYSVPMSDVLNGPDKGPKVKVSLSRKVSSA